MPSALSTIVTGRAWNTVIGGRGSEGLYQLAIEADGSIYGIGYTTGHLEGEDSTANDGGQCNPLLVKFRPNGLAARHKCEIPCNRMGLIALGGQGAM